MVGHLGLRVRCQSGVGARATTPLVLSYWDRTYRVNTAELSSKEKTSVMDESGATEQEAAELRLFEEARRALRAFTATKEELLVGLYRYEATTSSHK